MPRSPRPIVVAGLLATCLAAAGCSADVSGAAAPDRAPGDDAGTSSTAWMDGFCGTVLPFATAATTPPDVASAPDLATLQRAYSDYLGTIVSGVRDGRSTLERLGPAPEPGGDAAVRRVADDLTHLEQDVTGGKATVDAADPGDAKAFVASVAQVQETLDSISVPDVIGAADGVPQLAAAAERAPQCQKISSLAAAVPQ